jgi:hypothetical protein
VAKKAKYLAQKLTEEDKALIGQIFLKYALKFYSLKEKYQNPKAFAKVILKEASSRKNIAGIYTLAIAKNATSNHLFRPNEINQDLANIIQKNVQQDLKDMMLVKEFSNLYLHPSELRKVLKKLEKMGVFLHITTKDKIKDLERGTRHPGKKPSSYEGNRDRGGKPSVYRLTEDFEKLKNVMEKPGAVELLYEQIAKSGLAYQLTKFLQLGLWHAAKMDETLLHKLIGLGASFVQDGLREEDKVEFKAIHKKLQLLNDNQIEQIADQAAEFLVQNRDYYKFFVSTSGLLKLN